MAWLAGYPRDKIEWYPAIDHDKCVKCGMCMSCSRDVFDWTEDGARVACPYNCVVGCNTCANLCLGNAISFPDIHQVRDLYKREKIWPKVKAELAEQGKLKLRDAGE